MNEEYQRGQEIGELKADIKNLTILLENHMDKQDELNEKMDKRISLLESWVQTTTGKVVILTAIFGIVGSAAYIAINFFLTKIK